MLNFIFRVVICRTRHKELQQNSCADKNNNVRNSTCSACHVPATFVIDARDMHRSHAEAQRNANRYAMKVKLLNCMLLET